MKSLKKFKFFMLAAAMVLLLAGCGGEPKKEDVTAAIKKIMPMNFEVLELKAVDGIPGLFQVAVRVDKQPIVLYIDKKTKYIVSGSIVDLATKQNLTAEAQKKFLGK